MDLFIWCIIPLMSTQIESRALSTFSVDPFALAEQISGDKDTQANLDLALSFVHERAVLRKILFGELEDTHFRIEWDKFEKIVHGFGFEDIVSERVSYSGMGLKGTSYPKRLVAAHKDKKLLLVGDSFIWSEDQDEVINSVQVYATLKAKNPNDNIRDLLKGIPVQLNFVKVDDELEMEIDGREGLVTILNAIEERGCQFVDWHDPDRFIYLRSYSESQEQDLDFQTKLDLLTERRKEFLENCPSWVKDFIVGGE